MRNSVRLDSLVRFVTRIKPLVGGWAGLRNVKLRQKLLILNVTSILFICLMGGIGYSYLDNMASRSKEMYTDSLLPVKWLTEMKEKFRVLDADSLELILANSKNRTFLLKKDMEKQQKDMDELIAHLKGTLHEDGELALFARFQDLYPQYLRANAEIVDLAGKGQKQEAYDVYAVQVNKLKDRVNSLINEVSLYREALAKTLNAENDKSSGTAIRVTWVMALVAALLCTLIGIMITRAITRPVRALQKRMERAAGGDLSAGEDDPSRDEIGNLTRSFNGMLDGLRSLIRNVHENMLSLSAYAEQLQAYAIEGTQSSDHVSASSRQLAEQFGRQAEQMEEASRAVRAMDEVIGQIRQASEEVSQRVREATQASSFGASSVDAVTGQMGSISVVVEDANGVIKQLRGRMGEIESIIKTMQQVAKQSNILALNATIEAARAGQFGRGFAVVAAEVKKLSDESAISAKHIASVIQVILSDIGRAATAMQAGADQVAQGIAVTRDVRGSFRQIEEAVLKVNGKVDNVNGAILNLNEGSNKILSVMDGVNTAADAGRSVSREAAAASESQRVSANEIANSAKSLSRMAEDLQDSLEKFHI